MKNRATINKNPYTALDPSSKPLPIRIFNWLEGTLEKRGKSLIDLSADSLMGKAVRKTGLTDWGDDESFRIPLKLLLESCREEPMLNSFGRYLVSKMMTELLCNRLCIQDEIKRHPEILDEEIRKPLFIVSLSRTGSTLLQNLLLQDPSSRYLRHWEAVAPSLHPRHLTKKTDPRIAAAKQSVWLLERFIPKFFTAHEISAEGPEECYPLLALSFVHEMPGVFQRYRDWLKEQDKIPTYRYYRQTLQLLQWHLRRDHWVLKAPLHLPHLEALLAVFPDACVVQTHRDPLKIVPSQCSLTATLGSIIFSDQVNLDFVSRKAVDEQANMLDNAISVRKSADPAQFYDVYYKDLMKDPASTVRDIYQYFGYNYDESMDERIQNWLAENRQYKKGVHHYSLEQFGLDEEIINRKFANYIKQYNIPKESS